MSKGNELRSTASSIQSSACGPEARKNLRIDNVMRKI
jgi:hypothetical protein